MRCAWLVGVFAVALYGAAAACMPITFAFEGSIDNDPFGVFDSAAFAGEYTFDSDIPQVVSTLETGGYAGSGGVYRMTVAFTGTLDPAVSGPYDADTLNITVNNDFFGPLDQYLVTARSSLDPALLIELTLSDFTGTAFSSTARPLRPPNLAAFSSARFALFGGTLDNPIEAEGALEGLRCTAGCASVPEPPAGALTAAALLALALTRRRRMPR